VTLSVPTKIFAFAGLVLAVGVAALGTLVLGHRKTAAGLVPVVIHPVKPASRSVHASAARPRPSIDAGLPAPLRAALAHSAIVVAVLDAPGIAGDSSAVREARQGAHAAHAGFALLNVRNEANAASLATKAPNATDPAVLVVRRPGTIAFELDGYADSQSVAQAAVDARS
jgi:hypothetical protein